MDAERGALPAPDALDVGRQLGSRRGSVGCQSLVHSSTLNALAALDPELSERAYAGIVLFGAIVGQILGRRMVSPAHRQAVSDKLTMLGMTAGIMDPVAADHPQVTVCVLAVSICYVRQVLEPSLFASFPAAEAADRLLLCEVAVPLLAGSVSLLAT